MACRLRVSCVLRRGAADPHDCVEAIGGVTDDGSRWWLSREQAIEGLEKNRWVFVLDWDENAVVELAIASDGCKVLMCGGDESFLLKMPECTGTGVARDLEVARAKANSH